MSKQILLTGSKAVTPLISLISLFTLVSVVAVGILVVAEKPTAQHEANVVKEDTGTIKVNFLLQLGENIKFPADGVDLCLNG